MDVSTLSEDVLLEIFFTCSEVDWDGNEPVQNLNLEWDWISVTHVSRYWRNIALSAPFLWRKPALARHSRDRLGAFLERSQNAPLTIYSFSGCSSYSRDAGMCNKCADNMVAALHHLHHIHRLCIHHANQDIVNAMLDKPAPLLQDLILCRTTRFDYEVASKPLPVNFLMSNAPSLKRLVLRGFHLSYNSDILRGLECLEMQNPTTLQHLSSDIYTSTGGHYPTVHELLDILASSKNLTQLNIFQVQYNDTDKGECPILTTDSLTSFEIHQIDVALCNYLLYYFEIPTFANIGFGLRYTDSSELPGILSILNYITEQKYCHSLTIGFTSTRVNGYVDTLYGLGVQDVPWYGRSTLSLIQTIDEVALDEDTDYSESLGLMTNLIRGSSWKSVVKLDLNVSTNYALDDHQWRMFMDSFECLEYLSLKVEKNEFDSEEESVADIVLLENTLLSTLALRSERIAQNSGVISQEAASAVILPHLTGLTICLRSFTQNFDHLQQCMRIRSESGASIQKTIVYFHKKTQLHFEADWCTEQKNYIYRMIDTATNSDITDSILGRLG